MPILENKWSGGESIFVMYKTCSGYERFTSHFFNFQSVSSIQACLRKLIDLNDAWIWDGSMMKQAAVDLNTGCRQGQHGEESVNLTKIQLHQHLVSLDSSICPAITLALSPSAFTQCLPHSLLQMLLFLAFLHDIFTQCPSAPSRLFFLLLVKYNIYLSLFEFTHPYHWVSSRWLRGGLV